MPGLYFYGIIKLPKKFTIKTKGIGGKKISLLVYKNAAAIISEFNGDLETDYKNLFTHDKVISEIFSVYGAILPAGFGLVAKNKDDLISTVLKPRYSQIIKDLQKFSDKIEIDLKAIWTNMENVYQEISYENPDIMVAQKILQTRDLTFEEKVEIGRKIAISLARKKVIIKNSIIELFKKATAKVEEKPIKSEDIIFSLSFLLPKEKDKDFNSILEYVDRKLKDENIYLKKIGPIAPFNFFKLKIT